MTYIINKRALAVEQEVKDLDAKYVAKLAELQQYVFNTDNDGFAKCFDDLRGLRDQVLIARKDLALMLADAKLVK